MAAELISGVGKISNYYRENQFETQCDNSWYRGRRIILDRLGILWIGVMA